jgi:hypothetical protein
MPRPGLLPIAAAVALTVAAGLSIAAEQTRSPPATSLGAPRALPSPQGAGGATPQAKGTAASTGSPAVGSRALTGHEEESTEISPAHTAPDRASE